MNNGWYFNGNYGQLFWGTSKGIEFDLCKVASTTDFEESDIKFCRN